MVTWHTWGEFNKGMPTIQKTLHEGHTWPDQISPLRYSYFGLLFFTYLLAFRRLRQGTFC
jgi:hypothetical protein